MDIRNPQSPLVHSAQNVPHGAVDYVNYWSESIGTYGNAIVYTPPFYDKNKDKKYPVFYLIAAPPTRKKYISRSEGSISSLTTSSHRERRSL